jgi:hypothetical protein
MANEFAHPEKMSHPPPQTSQLFPSGVRRVDIKPLCDTSNRTSTCTQRLFPLSFLTAGVLRLIVHAPWRRCARALSSLPQCRLARSGSIVVYAERLTMALRMWPRGLVVVAVLLQLLSASPRGLMAQAPSTGAVDPPTPRTSWQLTFRFEGSRVDLIRRERLRRPAPGPASPAPFEGKNSGAWLVVLDEGDRPMFHRLLHDPFQIRAERHSPDGSVALQLRPPTSGEFQAIVSDLPGMRSIVLFSSPPDPERWFEPARELARFRLDDRPNR